MEYAKPIVKLTLLKKVKIRFRIELDIMITVPMDQDYKVIEPSPSAYRDTWMRSIENTTKLG